ncbi:MAG: peptidoglycan D,D-transpeptidase FtsI family protein [Nitrospinota bacterium]
MRKQNKSVAGIATIRVTLIYVALLLWFGVVIFRVAQLTLASDSRVEYFSDHQGVVDEKIDLPRGVIYDRNKQELALSIEMDSIYINPKLVDIDGGDIDKIATALEPLDQRSKEQLRKRLLQRVKSRGDKNFVWIKRKASEDEASRVRSAKVAGIGFVKESRRFYPKKSLASRIIGFSGVDNQGLSGIEYKFDDLIGTVQSNSTSVIDAYGRLLKVPTEIKSMNESQAPALVLTIDERIQFITENALANQLKKTNAKSAVAIVMDPKSGQILAMGEQPKFNANSFSKYDPSRWNPMAVSKVFEPGSTMKIFSAAAAIEEGALKANDIIYCENGNYKVANHIFREAKGHKYKYLSLSNVLVKSSNIGAIKVGEKLGADRLYEYVSKFGFGSRTGIDLPGESAGLLKEVKDWSKVSLASISFGQEIGVTPIQLATAMSVIANDGWLVKPLIAKALVKDGKVVKEYKIEKRRRVISSSTAKILQKILRKVVHVGTGNQAEVDLLEVAGKTGTAQKIDPTSRRYSKDRYVASFAGFAPANDPKLVVVVVIDEAEKNHWGGTIAAPVFAEIISRSFNLLSIQTEGIRMYEVDWHNLTKEHVI